jgi:hypothetical protein
MAAPRWTVGAKRSQWRAMTSDEGTDEAPAEASAARPPRPEEQDPKMWKGDGWTARVIKNEDDDGWAVEMISDGESEPALVGPWTMGRDKKNPKPLDVNAFATLVKTANEVMARHAQQRRALLHRDVTMVIEGARMRVDLDVVPDDDDPHAILTVRDEAGQTVTSGRVSAGFKLTVDSARRWIEQGGASEP